jgi:hypothetical protein
VDSLASLNARRLEHWRQTPETHLAGPDDAVTLIERLGIVTLYPASPEVPNLYHAYVGDPERKTEPQWDSPAGQVFGWRWSLGRRSVAFYTLLVRKRSTWVRWDLLPAVLRLWGELRALDELDHMGHISPNAYRIARALEEADAPLSTGDLRQAAGLAAGREQRNAYLKAVEELESRLLLAKVLAPEDDDMRHALVSTRYRDHVDAAERMTREAALDAVLAAYLPCAVYALLTVLARHLRLPEAELRAGLDRLVATGSVTAATVSGVPGDCYVWSEPTESPPAG